MGHADRSHPKSMDIFLCWRRGLGEPPPRVPPPPPGPNSPHPQGPLPLDLIRLRLSRSEAVLKGHQ